MERVNLTSNQYPASPRLGGHSTNLNGMDILFILFIYSSSSWERYPQLQTLAKLQPGPVVAAVSSAKLETVTDGK